MITSAELTGANPDLLEEEGGGGGQQGQEFNPFGQGGASPGGGGVQQGQGQTLDDGGFGSQSPQGSQVQNFGNGNNNSPPSFNTYVNGRYEFSIKFPSTWEYNTEFVEGAGALNFALFNAHNEEGNMYLFVDIDNSTDAKSLSLENYSDMYITKIMNQEVSPLGIPDEMEIEERFELPVGNSDGYMVIYNQTLELEPVNVIEKTAEAWTKLGNHGYIHFRFVASPSTAYTEFEELAVQMLNLFQFPTLEL